MEWFLLTLLSSGLTASQVILSNSSPREARELTNLCLHWSCQLYILYKTDFLEHWTKAIGIPPHFFSILNGQIIYVLNFAGPLNFIRFSLHNASHTPCYNLPEWNEVSDLVFNSSSKPHIYLKIYIYAHFLLVTTETYMCIS